MAALPAGDTDLGSIAGYDLVLAISEEAINHQLQLLYDHEIPSDDLSPPTLVDGAAPPPQANYLINHNLSIHLKDPDTGEVLPTGIDGHIACPKISFPADPNHRLAQVTITFKSDEKATVHDSIYTYWDVSGMQPKIKKQNINGFTMSWQVDLTRQDIQDVQKGKRLGILFIVT
jgi:hypothetical protein